VNEVKTADEAHGLRSDARRNRERIVAVATDVFAERGVNASLEEVAQQAGVGIGTLYRRFPTRQALVEAIFEERVEALVEVAEQAATDPDAWHGFATFLDHALAAQAANRGLRDVFTDLPPTGRMVDARTRIRRRIEQLMTRAQKQGSLRRDVALSDISMLFWAISRIVDATSELAPEAWRRHLALVLDAFRATDATAIPIPPLTEAEVDQAMHHLRALSAKHRT
jgi:AcrR family transcriptional regulator